MLKLLGLAWSAWKLSVKRLGPAGALVFSLLVVAGFVFVRDYLSEEYPALGEAVEQAV